MLSSYLTTALRSLRRRPVFATVNVLGLTIGMACCLLIGMYVQNELSYDRFHEDADRIHRVVQRGDQNLTGIGDGALPVLREEVPGIDQVVRVYRQTQTLVVEDETGGTQPYETSRFVFADAGLFELFDFPLVHGTPEAVLDEPNEIVLSETTARRYFGTTDAVEKTLSLDGGRTLTVSGVMEDLPANTHFDFKMAASFGTFYAATGRDADAIVGSFWYPFSATYVRLAETADPVAVGAKVDAAINERRRPDVAQAYDEGLQAVTDIHLNPTLDAGDRKLTRIYVFGAIALFILGIACINFVNLSTARAVERAREVGVRKSVGAHRGQLVRQFLGEAMLISLVAAVFALGLTAALRPVLEAITGTTLAVGLIGNPWFWGIVLAVILLAGLGAGSYPAFFLTRYQPAAVVRGSHGTNRGGGARLRQGLVVTQFAISVVLIVAATVAYQQLTYMQDARLGFDDAQLVTMDAPEDYLRLKDEMETRSKILQVTAASVEPGLSSGYGVRYEIDGRAPEDPEERLNMQVVDFGFFQALGVDVIAGRPFDPDRPSDIGEARRGDQHAGFFYRDRAVMLNRTAVEKMGWTPEEALGQTVRVYTVEGGTYYLDQSGTVVGVVEDYHVESLRSAIEPVVYLPMKIRFPGDDGAAQIAYVQTSRVIAKMAPNTVDAAMATIQDAWSQAVPGEILDATYLDDRLARLYETEQRTSQIIALFSLIAVLVACLGLFGLATYTTKQREKEIGIRKAVGASSGSIVLLLSSTFVRLVGLAVLLATPIAYLLVRSWLSDFAYPIDLGPTPFVAAAVLALTIALATTSTQALRAARVDPARVLRNE